MTSGEPRITIATVTHNCLEYTKVFFKYLQKFADVPYRLIIIDNNSTDGTREWLRKQQGCEVIYNRRNMGFAYANNQAFSRTTSEYFLGLNNDTVIFPNFLERCLRVADTHTMYSEFGVASNCIGARYPETDTPIDPDVQSQVKNGEAPDEIIHTIYGDMQEFAQEFRTQNPGLEELQVPPHFVGGWCFLIRTAAVRTKKLFDTQFTTGFYEDSDLSWSLRQRGLKIAHINELYIHHFSHVSFRGNKLGRSDHAISRKNAKLFAAKWSDTIRVYLQNQLDKGRTLEQIATHDHLFGSFFGRDRIDFPELEIRLTKQFLRTKRNFLDFLLAKK